MLGKHIMRRGSLSRVYNRHGFIFFDPIAFTGFRDSVEDLSHGLLISRLIALRIYRPSQGDKERPDVNLSRLPLLYKPIINGLIVQHHYLWSHELKRPIV